MIDQLLEKIPSFSWVKVGISLLAVLAVVLTIGLGYRHYVDLEKRVTDLAAENSQLKGRVEGAENRVREFAAAQDKLISSVAAMGKANEAAMEETRRLGKLFAEHDLGALARRKPGMVEPRINRGSADAQRMLECASGNRERCGPAAPQGQPAAP